MVNMLLWLLCGIGLGACASSLLRQSPERDLLVNSAAGAMGAVLGGTAFAIVDNAAFQGINPEGLLVAFGGALLVIVLAQLLAYYLLKRQ